MSVADEAFEEVAPDDPRAVELYRAHTLAGSEALGIPPLEPETVSEGLEPPGGALLLARIDGEPVAIG
jgi:hypothetical protein